MKIQSRGMSLLELMTALAVVGVLIGLAAPTFRTFTADASTTAATNDLVTALNLARSEALRSARPAIVCASADQATCSGELDWATGWIVFADTNGDGDPAATEVRQVWSTMGGGVTVTSSADQVIYDAMGMGQLGGAANVTFDIVPPSCSGERARATVVSIAGTIQSRKLACP